MKHPKIRYLKLIPTSAPYLRAEFAMKMGEPSYSAELICQPGHSYFHP
jgi:hypothetical protein